MVTISKKSKKACKYCALFGHLSLLTVLPSRRLCYRLQAEIVYYWSVRWLPLIADISDLISGGVLGEDWSLDMICSCTTKIRSISYSFVAPSY